MNRERGRPRAFDTESALDGALKVFWKHGFQDASLQELTREMGLSKPSLYAAFGDKEALYLQALERYLMQRISKQAEILNAEKNGRQAITSFLHSISGMLCDPMLPGGCFIINGTADLGGTATPSAVEFALRKALQASEGKLLERLLRAKSDGELHPTANPNELAATFFALLAGIAVLAKSGASRAKLQTVIDTSMNVWPEPSPAKKQTAVASPRQSTRKAPDRKPTNRSAKSTGR
jgi:TetR/AcrR family transcriptional regulator, copper-responsive repressor